jgi:hypothetical protein
MAAGGRDGLHCCIPTDGAGGRAADEGHAASLLHAYWPPSESTGAVGMTAAALVAGEITVNGFVVVVW